MGPPRPAPTHPAVALARSHARPRVLRRHPRHRVVTDRGRDREPAGSSRHGHLRPRTAGGRFRVTPTRRLVIVYGGEDDQRPRPFVAGQLGEPFRVADLEHGSDDVDASTLQPGAPYLGRATREGGTYKLRQTHGGVIERRGGPRGSEFALTDPSIPDRPVQNGVRLLQACQGTGEGGLTFHVSAAGHAWFLKAGQPRFLAAVSGGFAWPSERPAPPGP
jgi:hypothetical protein